jgi:phospholipid transport system substrate-binding protein
MIRFAALLAALFLFTAPLHAAPSGAAAPIERLDNALLEIMKQGKATPFPQRYATLEPVIQQVFDLPAILQSSVGMRWMTIPASDKEALSSAFLEFTVASYVANFNSYSGERFEVAPDTRPIGATEQVVTTKIIPTSGAGARIDYVMREGPAGWQVVDVLLDGSISRVAVQRSDFRSQLDTGGAPALTETLRKKVQDLSGGAGVR